MGFVEDFLMVQRKKESGRKYQVEKGKRALRRVRVDRTMSRWAKALRPEK